MKEYSRLVNTRTMLGWNPVTKDFKRNRSKHVQWFYEKESSPPFSLIAWECDYTGICTPTARRERESLIME